MLISEESRSLRYCSLQSWGGVVCLQANHEQRHLRRPPMSRCRSHSCASIVVADSLHHLSPSRRPLTCNCWGTLTQVEDHLATWSKGTLSPTCPFRAQQRAPRIIPAQNENRAVRRSGPVLRKALAVCSPFVRQSCNLCRKQAAAPSYGRAARDIHV
jgi:hypothetical protein